MSNAEFELYEDAEGKWRWRLVVPNGNIIADSGQGYASKQRAESGISSVKSHARQAEVVEVEEELDRQGGGR